MGYPPMKVAVNLSPRQFDQPTKLIANITQALRESGLEAKYLELEITESMVMNNIGEAIRTMKELEAMDVWLSMDDFGTGYSSLASLKKFPLNALKIGRSFVMDLCHDSDDTAIVLAIISLAKQLNLRVIAEGVETKEQVLFLTDHGCDELQGFYYSKPLNVEAFTNLLANPKIWDSEH